MTTISLLVLWVVSSFNVNASEIQKTKVYHGKVLSLSDGDTIHFMAKGETKKFKVRMLAIDTAELHFQTPDGKMVDQGYWAEQGAKELADYIAVGDDVDLEVYGEDVHGRKLGKVIKNGEDINLKMVRSGWASLYMICEKDKKCLTGNLSVKDLKAYREACRSAVTLQKGLFDKHKPVPELAFVFRANNSNSGLTKFVANLEKHTYVKPKEFEAVPLCDRMFYFTEKDAINNGFILQ